MENYLLIGEKLKFNKFFKLGKILAIILVVLTICISFFEYGYYLLGQHYAVELMKATSDEYDDFDGSYSELVDDMYRDLNPTYRGSMTIDVGKYGTVTLDDNSAVMDAAADADRALGKLLDNKGFDCYSGSKYLKFTGVLGYFKFYFWQSFDAFDDNGLLLGMSIVSFGLALIYLILAITYKLITNKELFVTEDSIVCQKKGLTVKQFLIKDITTVQSSFFKGLTLKGNGINHTVFLLENVDEIKEFIINKLQRGI